VIINGRNKSSSNFIRITYSSSTKHHPTQRAAAVQLVPQPISGQRGGAGRGRGRRPQTLRPLGHGRREVERLGEVDRGASGVGSAAAEPAPLHRRLLLPSFLPSFLPLSKSTTPRPCGCGPAPLLIFGPEALPLLSSRRCIFTGQTRGCWLGAPELRSSERGCSIGWEPAASARSTATPTGGRCRGGSGSAAACGAPRKGRRRLVQPSAPACGWAGGIWICPPACRAKETLCLGPPAVV